MKRIVYLLPVIISVNYLYSGEGLAGFLRRLNRTGADVLHEVNFAEDRATILANIVKTIDNFNGNITARNYDNGNFLAALLDSDSGPLGRDYVVRRAIIEQIGQAVIDSISEEKKPMVIEAMRILGYGDQRD